MIERTVPLLAATILLLPWPSAAQEFEGVLRQRSIEVDEEAIFERVYADSEDEPEFDSEAAWFRHAASTLFSIPLESWAGQGQTSDLTIHVKGDRLRMQDASGEMYTIIDLARGVTRTVNPAGRWYVEIRDQDIQAATEDAQRQAEEMMARMGIDPDDLEDAYADEEAYAGDEGGVRFPPDARPVGRSGEVNGFQAEAWEAESGGELGRGWCTVELDDLRSAMEAMGERLDAFGEDEAVEDDLYGPPGPDTPPVEDLLCGQGMPVQSQVLRQGEWGGLSYSITEILSVEAGPVADDRFEIPADYEKRNLQDLWR